LILIDPTGAIGLGLVSLFNTNIGWMHMAEWGGAQGGGRNSARSEFAEHRDVTQAIIAWIDAMKAGRQLLQAMHELLADLKAEAAEAEEAAEGATASGAQHTLGEVAGRGGLRHFSRGRTATIQSLNLTFNGARQAWGFAAANRKMSGQVAAHFDQAARGEFAGYDVAAFKVIHVNVVHVPHAIFVHDSEVVLVKMLIGTPGFPEAFAPTAADFLFDPGLGIVTAIDVPINITPRADPRIPGLGLPSVGLP
jgi:hypothetical protein